MTSGKRCCGGRDGRRPRRLWRSGPRPGAPRTITDEQIEEEVLAATLPRQPTDATHWSRAWVAAETGLSKSAVGRIWTALGLQPHLVDTCKISNDPQFIDKLRDVVGLYVDPPEKACAMV